tara:strand:- start:62 stop:502 length:441 start_codon:yes stop_codon:yes gene_type:complete
MGESKKSIYRPSFPQKYNGNVSNIICRSNWERKFCKWCDTNPNILEWSSEELWIRYISPVDNKSHRYFPDFIIKVKESDGKVKRYLIEVKPKKQTKPPVQKKKSKKSYIYECTTYAVNQAKWKAAKEWCDDRKIEFKLITEEELGL